MAIDWWGRAHGARPSQPCCPTKHYLATNNLRSEAYRGLIPDDLIDILIEDPLPPAAGRETRLVPVQPANLVPPGSRR